VRKPCENCPFRRSVRPPLGFVRRQEIAAAVLNDSRFGCHKTTTFKDGEYKWTPKERPCIGAALLIQRERGSAIANLAFLLEVMAGRLQVPIPDCAEVYKDSQEFINAEKT
jgi:hypothetical protein